MANFPIWCNFTNLFLRWVDFEVFPRGGSFGRKMHACSTQTASGTGGFTVGEGLTTVNGDIHMQAEEIASASGDIRANGNRQSNWRVPGTVFVGLWHLLFQVAGCLFQRTGQKASCNCHWQVATAIDDLGRRK